MKPNRFRFRAWDARTKQLINPAPIWMMVEIIEKESKIGDMGIHLMQSTGLVDEAGVEIFEGDIVSTGGANAVIKWSPFKATGWVADNTLKWNEPIHLYEAVFFRIRVIGNIHQHPHLLRG